MPAALSSANEAAVSLFLDGKIRFCEIAETVAAAMDGFANKSDFTVEDVFSADSDVRARVLAAKGVQ